jgi:hypothetical protein
MSRRMRWMALVALCGVLVGVLCLSAFGCGKDDAAGDEDADFGSGPPKNVGDSKSAPPPTAAKGPGDMPGIKVRTK